MARWTEKLADELRNTVLEGQMAIEDLEEDPVEKCACCGDPVDAARPPYCAECHQLGCP